MSTLIVYSDASDGFINSSDFTPIYALAREGTGDSSGAQDTGAFGNLAGQYLSPGFDEFACFQGYLSFDTSTVGAGSTVSAAVLNVTSWGDFSATDFTIEARLHDWGAALTFADYVAGSALSSKTLLAHYATSGGWVANTAYDFVDDAFAANVNKTGTTRLFASSSRQRLNNEPSGSEYVNAYFADQAGTTKDPKLTVTYSAGDTGGTTARVVTAYGPTANPAGVPGVGSATGTAQQPAAQIRATAGIGSATGTALQPTTRAEAIAAAGLGSATGTAHQATARPEVLTGAGAGAAIGTALDATTLSGAFPVSGLGAATGMAQSPTANPAGQAGIASALGAAYDPTGAVAAILGLVSAVGTAWDATVTVFMPGAPVDADAEVASATGTAWDATVQTLQPTTGGRRGVRRGGLPGQRKPLELPRILFLTPEAFAHPGVAQAIASAHGATTEWDDDETALMFLLGGLV